MTRDQLRAARILLHLKQPELADMAKMGVATLRRYEGGQDVGEIYADSLQRVIEGMGIVFLAEEPDDARDDADQSVLAGATPEARPKLGLGIAFRPYAELPGDTVKRLVEASSAEEKAKATGIVTQAEGSDAPHDPEIAPPKKLRGRPKKDRVAAAGAGGATADQRDSEVRKPRGRPKGKR